MIYKEYEQRLVVFQRCVAQTHYSGPRAGLSATLIEYAVNPERTDEEDDRFHAFINMPFHIRYAVIALARERLVLTEEDREFLGRVVAETLI